MTGGDAAWARAMLAAALFAVDPPSLPMRVRSPAGPARDAWLAALRHMLPPAMAVKRMPSSISADRLLGGVDLGATLAAGSPVLSLGLLSEAHNGVLIAATAERMPALVAGAVAECLDAGEIAVERDGSSARRSARFGFIAFDEGVEDEAVPRLLIERCALLVDLHGLSYRDAPPGPFEPGEIVEAAARLPNVAAPEWCVERLCGAAEALGAFSLRAPVQALRAAKAAAALAGRPEVSEDDIRLAAALVLAPRATRLPTPHEEADPEPPAGEPADPERDPGDADVAALEDRVIEAALAALPPGLLALLRDGGRRARGANGKSAANAKDSARGRPCGVRRGDPKGGAKLNIVETLRAAAPWQALRRRETPRRAGHIHIRREDFRITRFKRPAETLSIFVVDASGSQAVARLGEAKGAVETLLAESYVRRDYVALVSVKGRAAEIALEPTRSLARAKNRLSGLPGGGGTPLASGLNAALQLAVAAKRRGRAPVIALLTDGRANVALSGAGGRPQAMSEALRAASAVRAARIPALVIDTAPRRSEEAAALSAALDAVYAPLPRADAGAIAGVARAFLDRRA
ncbi:MAG: magnesium chelatase subunit D [Hyphomicrobiales bacterium]|nr:magnesium chelatase subunit D [Hyphomicrobiales bacterium]